MNKLPGGPPLEPMTKAQYRERSTVLRQALMNAQMDLRESSSSALLLVAGVDGGGKGETVQILNEWMDPRWIRTQAFDEPTTDEEERPDFWRYWRRLPPRGEIALFLSAWYSKLLLERVNGVGDAAFEAAIERIKRFEQMLFSDGMLIFKLWLHLDAAAQEKRFRELEANPLERWRVTPTDWANWSRYDDFAAASREILKGTDTAECSWHIVEGSDDRRREIEVGEALVIALNSHASKRGHPRLFGDSPGGDDSKSALPDLKGAATPVARSTYRTELARLQGKLNKLYRRAREKGIPLVVVFEGRDAAGKGGSIRRVVSALDARRVDVARIGPPTEEELMHHYLWRFWRRIPRAGCVTLFDRSWYGRVLPERVAEPATDAERSRAYGEIIDFERQIVEDGSVVVKFWLEIDRDEQERRFAERSRVPHKRWKLTDADLRNRELWEEYDAAIANMIDRTSTDLAPWTIVAANEKRNARLEVLSTIVSALEVRLEGPNTVQR